MTPKVCDLLGLVLTRLMDKRLDKNLDSVLLWILLSGPDLSIPKGNKT